MIIVLTPVKNEEWILEQFLQTTSLFADCIIIADQQSNDRSPSIYSKYPKVRVIDNQGVTYNEAERQVLLIQAARQMFPNEERILFSLDADEIISADSLTASGWETIRNASAGTVFKFEKPTIFFDPSKTIRYSHGWPLAYKDDGAEHKASIIHSTRIPTPPYSTQIFINDIKFLHLCFIRKNIQFSKNRFYCVLENLNNVRSLRMRRVMYQRYKPEDYLNEGFLRPTHESWFDHYRDIGIDLRNFEQEEFYWMDFEVLRIFHKHGTSRFFNDSIWHFNWEACQLEAIKRNLEYIPQRQLAYPSVARIKFLDILFGLLNKLTLIKRQIFRFLSISKH